ncbi:hypothetical protein GCM10027299_28990 [Larkinella ripae]
MGLTEKKFWRMTPLNFYRLQEGYQRRNQRAGLYFRETYALLCNIHRGKGAELVKGTDVLRLPGDEQAGSGLPKGARVSKHPGSERALTFSRKKLAKLEARFNPPPKTAA